MVVSTEAPPGRTVGRARVESGRGRGVAASVAGGLGVVVAVLPAGWPFAVVLAIVAVVLGGRVMRQGPGAAGFASARTAVALGLIAGLLALVSAGMWLAGS